MRSWTIGQPCIKLITDSIYHGFKRSLLVVFFAGPTIVLACDCHHQSNSINTNSYFAWNYAAFHRIFKSGWKYRKRAFMSYRNICILLNKYVRKHGLNWCVNSLHISELERPSSCSCLTVPYVHLGSLFVDLQVVSRWPEQLSAIIIAHKPYSRESEKRTFVRLRFKMKGCAMSSWAVQMLNHNFTHNKI